MAGIRSFIALPTTENVRHAIADIQSKLKATHADVKWESQEKFHITLVFLGSVEQARLELLSQTLAKSVQHFRSCTITYESIGAFPKISNPRVLWAGTRPNQTLLELQSTIVQKCAEGGLPTEDRAFHPHITLGRVKEGSTLGRLTEAIKTITFEPIETLCSEVLLMKSELHPSGSIYTILKSFPLQP